MAFRPSYRSINALGARDRAPDETATVKRGMEVVFGLLGRWLAWVVGKLFRSAAVDRGAKQSPPDDRRRRQTVSRRGTRASLYISRARA